jgi:hypothetical protein
MPQEVRKTKEEEKEAAKPKTKPKAEPKVKLPKHCAAFQANCSSYCR